MDSLDFVRTRHQLLEKTRRSFAKKPGPHHPEGQDAPQQGMNRKLLQSSVWAEVWLHVAGTGFMQVATLM